MKLGLAADGLAVGEPDARALEAEAPDAGPDCVLAGELQPAASRQARPLTAAAKLFRIDSLSRFAGTPGPRDRAGRRGGRSTKSTECPDAARCG